MDTHMNMTAAPAADQAAAAGASLSESAAINELATALSKAQGAFSNPEKDRRNPHFGSCYATLGAVIEATRKALAANGLVPINVVDLTAATIPYWELRAESEVATGIEEAFLTAYREGSFHYLLIAADRV